MGCSSFVFEKKKDELLRMYIDYNQHKKFTTENKYPLSRIENLFDQLLGAAILKNGLVVGVQQT